MNVQKSKVHSLIWPVLSLIAGIIVAFYDVSPRLEFIIVLCAGSIISVAFILHYSQTRRFFFLLTIFYIILFFITGWGITSYQKDQYQRYDSYLSENGHPKGTIVDISQFSKMVRIHIRTPSKNWWHPPHYFNINLLKQTHPFQKGQVIELKNPLKQIVSSKNPYTFQAKEYWRTQNTSHEIFLYNSTDIQLIRNDNISSIENIRQKVGHRIDELYQDPTQVGLLKALLLGQKEGLSKSLKDDFKKAGLMHILAVSGLHVGIISVLLFFILLPIKLLFPKSWLHTVVLLIALWIYAILTGMNTPVVRAVILATFYLTASRIDRKIDKWNIYFWAVLIVLILQPISLFTISFQLSFGAVASILLFYKKYYRWICSFMGKNYFSELVAVSLAAQTGIFPLLLYHFQEFSFIGTLSSLLVIPLLFPLIVMTSLSVMIPDYFSSFSLGLSKAGQFILELITDISNALAGWSFSSSVWVWNTYTLGLIFSAILLAGIFLEMKKINSHTWIMYGSIGCLMLAGLCESLVIYKVRNQPIVVIYEHGDQPITELYYHGVCYTDYKESPAPFLIRNRKKHYTAISFYISDVTSWNNLLTSIGNRNLNLQTHKSEIIHLYNYSIHDGYFAKMILPVDNNRVKTKHIIIPL